MVSVGIDKGSSDTFPMRNLQSFMHSTPKPTIRAACSVSWALPRLPMNSLLSQLYSYTVVVKINSGVTIKTSHATVSTKDPPAW